MGEPYGHRHRSASAESALKRVANIGVILACVLELESVAIRLHLAQMAGVEVSDCRGGCADQVGTSNSPGRGAAVR